MMPRIWWALLSLVSGVSAVSADSAVMPDSVSRHSSTVSHLEITTGLDYMASSVGDELRGDVAPEDKVFTRSALPVHLKYSFSFTNPEIRNYIPGGYQGIGLGVMNFGALDKGGVSESSRYIGYPVLTYIFQGAPFWHINPNLSMGYEWNFGAAFGWKPYSDFNRVYNLTVGSRVNAYLNVGIKMQWQVNPHISLTGALVASHFSNGNTSWPNPGVNSFGVRVGMEWTINPLPGNYPLPPPADSIKKRKLEYDLSLWASTRKRVYKGGDEHVLLPGHYACAGISFAPMYRLGRWFRVGGSADIQWDESSNMKKYYVDGATTEDIRFYRPPFGSQISLGLSAHGELQMPIFALNIGIGCNILSPPENRGLYQNITLKTYIGPKFFLNVGYQLRNFSQQSNLMLGLGLSI